MEQYKVFVDFEAKAMESFIMSYTYSFDAYKAQVIKFFPEVNIKQLILEVSDNVNEEGGLGMLSIAIKLEVASVPIVELMPQPIVDIALESMLRRPSVLDLRHFAFFFCFHP